MEQFKRVKVVMLPTEKGTSSIAKSINQDILSLYNKNDDKYNQWINQNLYITSDDEIKEGDWFINLLDNSIHQATNWIYVSTCKKIIATTDTSLTLNTYYEIEGEQKVNLPQPSQQFIEKYIESYNKGEVITDVLVEYELSYEASKIIEHHINKIPKLKVDKNNTITIKKVKDSWNREEVIILIKSFEKDIKAARSLYDNQGLDKWIEQNL